MKINNDSVEDAWLGLGDLSLVDTPNNPMVGRSKYDIEHPDYHLLKVLRNPKYLATTCKILFDKINNKDLVYNTDGLIFTPTLLGVGCNSKHDKAAQRKVTWKRSFKWKPASHNTIDFLIKTVKSILR